MPEAATPYSCDGIEYVIELDGMTRNEIFDGVELWIAENFTSSKAVIDLKNKEQGVIIGNGVLTGATRTSGMCQLSE
ncbi:MAG: DUF4468 domain-containing protein [Opitutales bacterium]|nr:DUF4468 domain-containing protein [Opitutales bacterium]